MPRKGDSLSHGDLYVTIEVIFPKKLNKEQIAKLKEILPKSLLPKPKETKNKYTMQAWSDKKHSKNGQSS